MQNIVGAFDLIPGLVVELLGQPAIVISIDLDIDQEVNTVIINTPHGDHTLTLSWAEPDSIQVIGVCQGLHPDNITLFDR